MSRKVIVFELYFFFFFKDSFNLWHLLLIIVLYHLIKTPIDFWCKWGLNLKSLAFYHQTKTLIGFCYRWGLNPKSFIQPSEILPIELIRTHFELYLDCIVSALVVS